jgi:hypothetical protein
VSCFVLSVGLAQVTAEPPIRWTDTLTAIATAIAAVGTLAAVAVAIYLAFKGAELARHGEEAAEQRRLTREADVEDRQFKAAALLVRDELRANEVRYEIALNLQPGQPTEEGRAEEVPDGLASQTYQDLQLLLAQHSRLDQQTRDAVRGAYVFARVPRSLERRSGPGDGRGDGQPGGVAPGPIDSQIKAALDRTRRALQLLAQHVPPSADI